MPFAPALPGLSRMCSPSPTKSHLPLPSCPHTSQTSCADPHPIRPKHTQLQETCSGSGNGSFHPALGKLSHSHNLWGGGKQLLRRRWEKGSILGQPRQQAEPQPEVSFRF